MKDKYLDNDIQIARLVKEWKEHNGLIIAFDFDNTIYDYHNEGATYDSVITLLKECKDMGCTLILHTCCNEDKYEFMKNYCEEVGIEIDYINESPISFGGNKIYYNILLDDRSGLQSAYEALNTCKELIRISK